MNDRDIKPLPMKKAALFRVVDYENRSNRFPTYENKLLSTLRAGVLF